MIINLYTDGGARGNPGPAAIGVVLKDEKNKITFELAKYVGETTNNEAEYLALIEGLNACLKRKGSNIVSHLDSELVTKQLNKEYKVKHAVMKKHYDTIQLLLPKFSKVKFVHIKRSLNKEADGLVNQALDAQENK